MAPPAPPASLLALPAELLDQIVGYLPTSSIEPFTLACRPLAIAGAKRLAKHRAMKRRWHRVDIFQPVFFTPEGPIHRSFRRSSPMFFRSPLALLDVLADDPEIATYIRSLHCPFEMYAQWPDNDYSFPHDIYGVHPERFNPVTSAGRARRDAVRQLVQRSGALKYSHFSLKHYVDNVLNPTKYEASAVLLLCLPNLAHFRSLRPSLLGTTSLMPFLMDSICGKNTVLLPSLKTLHIACRERATDYRPDFADVEMLCHLPNLENLSCFLVWRDPRLSQYELELPDSAAKSSLTSVELAECSLPAFTFQHLLSHSTKLRNFQYQLRQFEGRPNFDVGNPVQALQKSCTATLENLSLTISWSECRTPIEITNKTTLHPDGLHLRDFQALKMLEMDSFCLMEKMSLPARTQERGYDDDEHSDSADVLPALADVLPCSLEKLHMHLERYPLITIKQLFLPLDDARDAGSGTLPLPNLREIVLSCSSPDIDETVSDLARRLAGHGVSFTRVQQFPSATAPFRGWGAAEMEEAKLDRLTA